MKKAKSTFTMGLILLFISFSILSCEEQDIDIRQNFPFEVSVMPVPLEISPNETVEIRVNIQNEGNYENTKYFIRYFQFKGVGNLRYFDNSPYQPNDLYELEAEEFRLYYTSFSEESTEFSVWISDNFGNEKQLDFKFANRT